MRVNELARRAARKKSVVIPIDGIDSGCSAGTLDGTRSFSRPTKCASAAAQWWNTMATALAGRLLMIQVISCARCADRRQATMSHVADSTRARIGRNALISDADFLRTEGQRRVP